MAANVMFKRGTQANLEPYILGSKVTGGKVGVDGTFYLTTDTHRLYVGNGDKAVPVNEGVVTVATVGDLPNSGLTAGDFAYVQDSNILCVFNGKAFIQINENTDCRVDSVEAKTTGTDSATVTINVITNDLGKTTNDDHKTNFVITGEKGVTIKTDGSKTITISGDTYSIGADATSNGDAQIKLTSAKGQAASTATIKGGAHATFNKDASGNVKLDIEDMGLDPDSSTTTTDANGIHLKTYDHLDTYVEHVINPVMKIGATDATSASVGITADTDGSPIYNLKNVLYSRADIDKLMHSVNALSYKGTVGQDGKFTALPSVNVENGDLYLASSDFTIANGVNGSTQVHKGDMIIAQGDEGSDGKIASTDLKWTVITSGKEVDKDTTYKASFNANQLKVTDQSGDDVLFTLTAKNTDNLISVTMAGDPNNNVNGTLTINHKEVARNDPAAVNSNSATHSAVDSKEGFLVEARTLPVVTSITTNSQGHVTAVQVTNYEVLDTVAVPESLTMAATNIANNGGIKIATTYQQRDANGQKLSTKANFDLTTSSLAVKATAAGASIDIEWGTFD